MPCRPNNTLKQSYGWRPPRRPAERFSHQRARWIRNDRTETRLCHPESSSQTGEGSLRDGQGTPMQEDGSRYGCRGGHHPPAAWRLSHALPGRFFHLAGRPGTHPCKHDPPSPSPDRKGEKESKNFSKKRPKAIDIPCLFWYSNKAPARKSRAYYAVKREIASVTGGNFRGVCP